MLPQLLTFNQAKDYLQIGKDSLLDLLHNGELKGFKLKGRWRIHENDLNNFMDSLRGEES